MGDNDAKGGVHINPQVAAAQAYLKLLHTGTIPRYSFGWGREVDGRTGGMEPENLIVVAGGNKQGKTTAAVNTVYHNLEASNRVLVVTTEISAKWYLYRVAARSLGLSVGDIRSGFLSKADFDKVLSELERFTNLFIGDHPHCKYADIEKDVEKYNPNIVIVDHFQRLDTESSHEAIGYKRLAQLLKQLAVESHIPIMVLSQTHLDDGWKKHDSSTTEYDITKMRTRWTNELHGEADKILYLDNLGASMHIVYHSMRDYASGGYTKLVFDPEQQYLGEALGGPF